MRLIALVLVLTGCASGGGDAPGGGRPSGPVVVRVAPARAESIEDTVELTGTLTGAEEVTVAAEVEAPVEAIAADMGDVVKAGDVLVKLDVEDLKLRAEQAEAEHAQAVARLGSPTRRFDPEDAAAVRRARADLEEARRSLGRGEELLKRQVASAAELDALRTRLAVAESALQSALEEARSASATADGRRASAALARKRVRDAVIRSPVDGAVARRFVAPGELVKIGQAVARVVVTDPLELRGEVPERYTAAIRPGLAVRATSDALPGVILEGTVSRVSPEVNPTSRTFTVEARIPDPERRLKPGLFARGEIRVGGSQGAFAVPETAVASTAGVTQVYVEQGGKAAARPVRLIRKRGGDALVAGSLKVGERVIVTGVARLFDGAEVKVDDGPPASAAPTGPDRAAGGTR